MSAHPGPKYEIVTLNNYEALRRKLVEKERDLGGQWLNCNPAEKRTGVVGEEQNMKGIP